CKSRTPCIFPNVTLHFCLWEARLPLGGAKGLSGASEGPKNCLPCFPVCDEHSDYKDAKLLYRFRKDDGTFPLNKEVKVFLRGQSLYETLIGMDNSILKAREENLVKFQRSFLGCEMVDWLVEEGEVANRKEATELCQTLLEHGIIQQVSAQCHFYDRDLLYQFRINFRRRRRLTELLSETLHRSLSDSPDSPFCLRKLNPELSPSSFLSGPNRLKLTVLSEDRLQMKWKESEGNTSGYKVRVKPMAGDSEQEVMLKTKMAKATVGGLSPTKEYTLQIYILNGSQEALLVKRKFVRLALTHVLEHNLKEEAGARPEASKLLILLTDGKSQDDASPPAQTLKNMGIKIFAVGVKNADETELRQVASEPLEMTVYNVVDFPLLRSLVSRLTWLLCAWIKEKDQKEIVPLSAPQSLRTSEISHNSIKLMWEPVEGATQYLILSSSTPNGAEDDTKETEYLVSVFPVYENAVGDGLRGISSTRKSWGPQCLYRIK
ncbi:PREDICTED: collagen alpha-1(XX) chain-like, partial [Thamnophis sirtalis]|uniref:Collagen alpha-1(XX) chain-like n=1 Tax=Thamnophis sirtalis TaxID=35019 RepID=A0A6I9XYX1_9SAUR